MCVCVCVECERAWAIKKKGKEKKGSCLDDFEKEEEKKG